MKGLKIIFWTLWRMWFYVLFTIPIVVMFPFLVASIVSEKAIRIILRWHAFGQNSFSLEWGFTIKSKKPGIGT
jgi:1-acyl-sn-glycerol-3-phosphate acyltransferase